MIPGMRKTTPRPTLVVDEDQQDDIERIAAEYDMAAADVLREAIKRGLHRAANSYAHLSRNSRPLAPEQRPPAAPGDG